MLILWFATLLYGANHAGNPWPLDIYIPLLNPLDLVILFILFTMIRWSMELRTLASAEQSSTTNSIFTYALGFVIFVWITGTVARSIHHWLGINYSMPALYRSVELQTTLTVVWTVVALGLTFVATRIAKRTLWLVGGGLLLLVVVKLFMIDLDNSGTLARIVSFLTVGLLLLLINYFSPIPPRNQETPA